MHLSIYLALPPAAPLYACIPTIPSSCVVDDKSLELWKWTTGWVDMPTMMVFLYSVL
jgi:hypothetical protein